MQNLLAARPRQQPPQKERSADIGGRSLVGETLAGANTVLAIGLQNTCPECLAHPSIHASPADE
jgi:hypothetical protein